MALPIIPTPSGSLSRLFFIAKVNFSSLSLSLYFSLLITRVKIYSLLPFYVIFPLSVLSQVIYLIPYVRTEVIRALFAFSFFPFSVLSGPTKLSYHKAVKLHFKNPLL